MSIYSDVKEDLKQEVSIAEAVPVIAEIKGWGSGVGVYVTYTTNIPGGELRKILVPVCENHTLDLISYGKAADLPERIKQALVK